MANSCEEFQFRCQGCPMEFMEEEVATEAGALVERAVQDPSYSHLRSASVGEIVGMAAQTTERAGDPSLKGLVAGALTLVATGQCKRS